MSADDWPVEVDPIFHCWLWTSKLDKDGYGIQWQLGKARRAHIVVWESMNGPVPDGKVLDHGCNRRRCCAPHHAEVVTQSENLYRRSWRHRSQIKRCPKGLHDLSLHGQVTPEGGRVCRACGRGES